METQDTMTVQQEAEQLIDKIIVHSYDYENARLSAIIAVETIIQSGHLRLPEDRLYWKMVKKELENPIKQQAQ